MYLRFSIVQLFLSRATQSAVPKAKDISSTLKEYFLFPPLFAKMAFSFVFEKNPFLKKKACEIDRYFE